MAKSKRIRKTLLPTFFILVFSLLATPLTHAQSPDTSPSPFQLSVSPSSNQHMTLNASIATGYYLYKDKIHIQLTQPEHALLKSIPFPKARKKTFQSQQTYEVYQNTLTLPLTLQQPAKNQTITLLVQYQGCSEKGFCLAPQTVQATFRLKPPFDTITPFTTPPAKTSSSLQTLNALASLLNQQHTAITLLTFLSLGILLSLTPCILPMIPVLSSIILGQKKPTALRSFAISLSYVLGMATTYGLTGIIFGLIGSTLQSTMQSPVTIIIISVILLFMGLSSIGLYNIKLPACIQKHLNPDPSSHHKKTMVSTFIMGALSVLILSPCITPPLVAVLTYIGHQGNLAFGGLALFFMGLGLGVPLLVIGLFGKRLLPKTGQWEEYLKITIGFVLLFIAIWVISRLLNPVITTLLFNALGLLMATYLGAFKNANHIMGHIAKYLGLSLFVAVIIYSTTLLYPLFTQTPPTSLSKNSSATSMQDINQFFNDPQHHNKPIILNFSAHWCISCLEFKKTTLQNTNVKALLTNDIAYLNVDISQDTDEIKKIKQHYRVYAPPTLLFFDPAHQEINNARTIGTMTTQEFINTINAILQPFVLLPPQNIDLIPPSVKETSFQP